MSEAQSGMSEAEPFAAETAGGGAGVDRSASSARHGTEEHSCRAGDALIVVDVQNDFLPDGVLAVPGGGEVIEPLNGYIRQFAQLQLPVFATRDWHPRQHCSFQEQGGRWPAHCVAGTQGAKFPPELQLPPAVRVISKATQPDAEAYSGFQGTDLAQQLRDLGCTRVFVGGLATEYCVRATVLDARAAGLQVIVLADAIRALDTQPGDGEHAIAEMTASGAQLAFANPSCGARRGGHGARACTPLTVIPSRRSLLESAFRDSPERAGG